MLVPGRLFFSHPGYEMLLANPEDISAKWRSVAAQDAAIPTSPMFWRSYFRWLAQRCSANVLCESGMINLGLGNACHCELAIHTIHQAPLAI